MRIAGILKDSLCNGPGLRLTVFTQGCDIKCPGCHNPESHDIKGGQELSIEDILSNLTPITTGITISGGEPTMQWAAVKELCAATSLPVMIYSGRDPVQFFARYSIPDNVDYIKIGPYLKEFRSLTKQYGSRNQRIYSKEEIKEAKGMLNNYHKSSLELNG